MYIFLFLFQDADKRPPDLAMYTTCNTYHMTTHNVIVTSFLYITLRSSEKKCK